MKLLYAMAGAGVVAGGIHASGILKSGQVYAKPYSVVYAQLVSMPLPVQAESMFGGGVELHQAPDMVSWHFRSKAGEVAVFTARLTREDTRHTRVKVDFESGEALDEMTSHLASTELMRSTARSAMAEQLDARLAGRPYDSRHMGQILADHIQAHPEEVQEYGQSVRRMMTDMADQIRASQEGFSPSGEPASALSARSNERAMAEATRPAVELHHSK